MNRIDQKFRELRRQRKKAFIAFMTAGDPSLAVTESLVLAFERSGADIVEIGIPFSDPLADGPVIQASSQRALKNGVTVEKVLALVQRIRKSSQVPIALMTSYNPVFHFGDERFVRQARRAGVDGLIVPDLPPEEAANLRKAARAHRLSLVFFISPTTTPERMKKIFQQSSGFVYAVSVTGVTGMRSAVAPGVAAMIGKARTVSREGKGLPTCIGFGISNPQQAKQMAGLADGIIVGSAIVNEVERNKGKKELVGNVGRFVGRLVSAVKA